MRNSGERTGKAGITEKKDRKFSDEKRTYRQKSGRVCNDEMKLDKKNKSAEAKKRGKSIEAGYEYRKAETTEKRPRIQGQFCPVEKRCGGCQYLQLTNEQQLNLKQKKAEELLGKM